MSEEKKLFNRLTTIREVLDHCATPELMEDRVRRLKASTEVFPALKIYVRLAFSILGEFDHLLPVQKQKPVGKIPNRQEVSFQEFLTKHLPLLATTSPGSINNKKSKLAMMGDFLDPRDWELISLALAGQFGYANPRINEMVLKLAFPEQFPNA